MEHTYIKYDSVNCDLKTKGKYNRKAEGESPRKKQKAMFLSLPFREGDSGFTWLSLSLFLLQIDNRSF